MTDPGTDDLARWQLWHYRQRTTVSQEPLPGLSELFSTGPDQPPGPTPHSGSQSRTGDVDQ